MREYSKTTVRGGFFLEGCPKTAYSPQSGPNGLSEFRAGHTPHFQIAWVLACL